MGRGSISIKQRARSTTGNDWMETDTGTGSISLRTGMFIRGNGKGGISKGRASWSIRQEPGMMGNGRMILRLGMG